jgi:hypothetical protein
MDTLGKVYLFYSTVKKLAAEFKRGMVSIGDDERPWRTKEACEAWIRQWVKALV